MGKVILIASLLLLIACKTTGGSFCAVSQPIRPSASTIAHLSDAEVAQILAHNKKGERLCRWKP